MNTKGCFQTLEDNKVVLLVIYRDLKSPWHIAPLMAIYMGQV